MSDAERSGGHENQNRHYDWKEFGSYRDDRSGIQLIMRKGGGTFCPRIGFIHTKTGEFTSFGRITPDYNKDLSAVEAIDYIIEGLQRLRDQVNPAVRTQMLEDQRAFKERKAKQSNTPRPHNFNTPVIRQTGKTARKRAAARSAAPQPTAKSPA